MKPIKQRIQAFILLIKPKKLYIKILLYFLAFLIITEIAIFGFVALLAGKEFQERHYHYNDSKMKIAGELIAEHIKKSQLTPIKENESLKKLMARMGEVFSAMICLTEQDNTVLLKSFKSFKYKKITDGYIKKILDGRASDSKMIWLQRMIKKHPEMYMKKSLRFGDKTLILHMAFIGNNRPHPGVRFGVGLLAIGVVIAILIAPVSRQITRPVNNLADSARKIEQGDLAARADVKGKDEIGRLGEAFNNMAKKLETMVKSGKELTAQISHELRTPLARLRIDIELLKDKLAKFDETESREQLLDMEAEIEELDSLIGSILELSKLDIQETESASELFAPALLLENILQKFEPAMKSKGISLRTNIDSRAKIYGNRKAFASALSNIVDNARKFSPPGGLVNTSVLQENTRLTITVSNSCPRLSEQDLKKIFEPFYRVAPGKQNGTGLGLAIVKKIIDRHNGKISALATDDGIALKIEIEA